MLYNKQKKCILETSSVGKNILRSAQWGVNKGTEVVRRERTFRQTRKKLLSEWVFLVARQPAKTLKS